MRGFELLSKLRYVSRPGDKAASPRTCLARAAIEALEERVLFNAGGGFSGGGLLGSYYANTTQSGTPAFTRTDDRIDFPSAAYNAPVVGPGGSNSTGYNAVSGSAFSVHWSGDIIPKFAETYTFSGFEDDTFKLQISPKGLNTWTTVINQTGFTGTNATGTYTFPTAGAEYDVKIDYAQLSGNWAAQLQWSSPSTPLETIEPANPVGIGATGPTDGSTDFIFANAVKQSGPFLTLNSSGQLTGTDATTDADGNPTEDFGFYIRQAYTMAGTYAISGNSNTQPTITPLLTNGKWITPVSYNSSTHQFTATFSINDTSTDGSGIMPGGNFVLAFTNTGGGVQNLKVMLPTAPDSPTSLDPGLLYNPTAEALLETNYSIIRTMDLTATNSNPQTTWATRQSPLNVLQKDGNGSALSWEDAIQLANETGKDLWINIPMMADSTYVANLANLIKYGSDGTNPYTSTQANPVFPALNANLHVYIEWSNETWNSGSAFAQNTEAYNAALAAVTNNTPEGQIINYDGKGMSDAPVSRWTALKLQEASDTFRAVFGDAAMPGSAYGQNADPTIRPVLEWQTDADNNMLSFIDNYFNKTNPISTYAGTPHPVSYYFYGGGGAWYTSPTNDRGNSEITQPDSGFDLTIPDPWTFTGTAGIVASGANGAPATPDGSADEAYITGTGSFTENFTLPESEYVDIYFNADGGVPVTVTLDSTNVGIDINGNHGYVQGKADQYGSFYGPGYDFAGAVSNHDTRDIYLTAGTHTVTFTGTGTGSQTGYFDNVEVGTVNGILHSSLADISANVNGDAYETNAFGLKYTGYEGGLLIGGSPLGGPGSADITGLEEQAYLDTQASANTQQALANFQIDGGNLAVHYGSASEGAFMVTNQAYNLTSPVNVGYGEATSTLPALSNFGTTVPATIVTTAANQVTTNYHYTNRSLVPGGWVSWAINVPTAGTYNIATDAGAGGTQQIFVDGNLVGSGDSGQATTAAPDSVTLSAGLHVVRVACLGGSFQVTTLIVNSGLAPAAGTNLAAFDFFTRAANDQSLSVAATGVNANSTVSAIQAGSGFKIPVSGANAPGGFILVASNGDAPMGNLATAQTKGEYDQFSITPQSGYTQSLSALNAYAWTYGESLSTAIEYSTDGTNFTSVSQTANTVTSSPFSESISGEFANIPALQDMTGTAYFRIYLWGDNGQMGIGPGVGNDIALVGASVPIATAFGDAGFETPHHSGFTIRPTGSPWTFAGNAGIQANGSGFGAANAPEGTQTLFLEGSGANGGGAMGTVSQSLSFAAGTYGLTFQAASRASDGTTLQPIQLYVDGSAVGSPITPSSTSFAGYTIPFTVSAGTHAIELSGTVGYSTTFVDGMTISTIPAPIPSLGDFGFETPPQHVGGSGRLTYDPTGSPWTFAGNAGIQGNGSSLVAADALEGIQTAFLQGSSAHGGGSMGSVSQSVSLTAGTYAITFLAASRASDGSNVQPLQLEVDGTAVGSPITPSSTSFGLYTTASFTVSAGSHVIQLLATNSGAYTTFVDALTIVPG